MKNKLKKLLLCFIAAVLSATAAIPVSAEIKTKNETQAQSFVDGTVAYLQREAGVTSVQGLINGSLTKNAGSSSEWYAIALSQYGSYDFASYRMALLKYLDNNEVGSASSRQKYALALIACGSTDKYIYNALNSTIGKQGVMSLIFGLHLLNNGYTCNEFSAEDVKRKLLTLQHTDGGWSVTGNTGDVDVTAMAVQALAPHYKTDTSVKAAVNKALTLLSVVQKENGDFASYGVNNAESTAQVLVALSSIGIDCKTDTRFIKNGNTIFDGIALYMLSDGSFCHKQGGQSSGTATVQVFYSMVSYLRMKNGKSPLYVLDAANPSGLEIPTGQASSPEITDNSSSEEAEPVNSQASPSAASSQASAPSDETGFNFESTTSEASQDGNISASSTDGDDTVKTENKLADASETVTEKKTAGINSKLWICLAIAAAAVGACIALYCRKKRNIRNFGVIGIAAVVTIAVVLMTNFQSADSYYNRQSEKKQNVTGTVTITIRCDTVPDKSAEHIPDDGIILDTLTLEIEEGETVYEVLSEATAKNKIHLETVGNADSAYVKGISNIYEFDFGDLSGWMYFVNGSSPSVGCGEYTLSPGDKISWLYTCNMGKDLEN